jgi:molybdopterin converting factor small subunit
MRVSVRLMGPYKRLAGGVGDVDMDLKDPTLGGVLRAVTRAYPEAGKKLLPAPRKIEPAVRVVLNDVVLQVASVDQPVCDGDRVAFVPIVGGGFSQT